MGAYEALKGITGLAPSNEPKMTMSMSEYYGPFNGAPATKENGKRFDAWAAAHRPDIPPAEMEMRGPVKPPPEPSPAGKLNRGGGLSALKAAGPAVLLGAVGAVVGIVGEALAETGHPEAAQPVNIVAGELNAASLLGSATPPAGTIADRIDAKIIMPTIESINHAVRSIDRALGINHYGKPARTKPSQGPSPS